MYLSRLTGKPWTIHQCCAELYRPRLAKHLESDITKLVVFCIGFRCLLPQDSWGNIRIEEKSDTPNINNNSENILF
jgi:hypothetical protein